MIENIAQFLLNEGYLLTALEFYQELLEEGNENSLLKNYFENQLELQGINSSTNRNSIASLLKEKDDQLFALGYELQLAKEKINNLKAELLKQQSQTNQEIKITSTNNIITNKKNVNGNNKKINQDINNEDLEIRALNFIIFQHLLKHGFKLTAIAFQEEASNQELGKWENVGFKNTIEQPPDLITFYRTFYNSLFSTIPSNVISNEQKEAFETIKEDNIELRNKLSKIEQKYSQLQNKFDNLIKYCSELEKKLNIEKSSIELKISNNENNINDDIKQFENNKNNENYKDENVKIQDHNKESQLSKEKLKRRRTYAEVCFEFGKIINNSSTSKSNILNEDNSSSYARINQQFVKISKMEKNPMSVIKIIAECLPHVVPGVIFKKREELLPIILSIVSQHTDTEIRFNLIQLLFNLIKKPNQYERKIIVDGFIALASTIGEERTETELLSQCWTEISNKNPERRILVADCCGALAYYVRPELRPSLIFSILQQLKSDKDISVRESVVRNLSILVSLFETDEKFSKIQEFLFEFLYDKEYDVYHTAQTILLPIFSDWADSIGLLCEGVFNKIIEEIELILSKSEYVENGKITDSSDIQKLPLLITSFTLLIPKLKESVLFSSPFTNEIKNINSFASQQEILFEKFNQFIENNEEKLKNVDHNIIWKELSWILEICISKLIYLILKIDLSINQFVQLPFIELFSTFCHIFGEKFSSKTIKKEFQNQLLIEKDNKQEEVIIRSRLLHIYLCSILPTIEKNKKFSDYLKDLIINISVEEHNWNRKYSSILINSISLLCKSSEQKIKILDTLCDLIVHPANQVRAFIGTLFNNIINLLNIEEISKRVLPALITLAGDLDKIVKTSSILPLGNVIVNIHEDQQILDKIRLQLDSFFEDDSLIIQKELIKALTIMIPYVPTNFREQYILPKISLLIKKKYTPNINNNEKIEQAKLFFEAFRSLTSQPINEEEIKEYILPSLKILQNDSELLDSSYKSMISSMINDMEISIKNSNNNNNNNNNKSNLQSSISSSEEPITPSKSKAFFEKVRGFQISRKQNG